MVPAAMSNPSPKNVRRMRGFEAAAGLLRDRIRTAGESRGFAVSRLLTHWGEIAGDAVAAIAQPVKIGYGRDGLGATLTLLVQGAAAPLVQMQAERIRERVNACYGYNAVARIRLTQTSAVGFAEGQAPFAPAPGPAPAAEDPALRRQSAALSREIGDDSLRAALEALGEKVLSRARKTKG